MSQSHRKIPQNGQFCTVPVEGTRHMRKSTKKIQEICEFLSHTDWLPYYPKVWTLFKLRMVFLVFTNFFFSVFKFLNYVCMTLSTSGLNNQK